MPKWTPLKRDKILYNPYQHAFWQARRARQCKNCLLEFECPPGPQCPGCGGPSVRRFHRLTIIAGRRGGKTLGGSIAAAEEASIPDTIGWACAPTNPKLHRYVIPAFQQIIPPEWVSSWNSEYNDLRLKNGSLIHFQTLEDPDQGRGQGLDWLWIDEVCELTHLHWMTIEPSLTERRGVAFFTTSPQSYDWVYENLYLPAEEKTPGYWAIKYKTKDNPIIDRDEVESARAKMPDEMYRQEYEADFVVFQGAIYGASLESQVLRGEENIRAILPEWPAIGAHRATLVGLDAGADHPFGAVKLIATERGLVVVGEYLERHRPVIQHAASLKALANSSNVRWAINKNDPQITLELAQHGIFAASAENEVVSGVGRVQSWIANKQLWFIEALCPRTIKQMRAYRWADNTASDGTKRREKVYKREDELPDALRYALMTWPQLPKIEAAPTGRRIEDIPEPQRWVVDRMRRIDKGDKSEPETVTGDFWG
jgi:terminase large subunit-like protein